MKAPRQILRAPKRLLSCGTAPKKTAARWVALWALSCLLATSSFSAQGAKANATQDLVVLDTDIGDDIDDVLALSLVVSSPELKLLGITAAWGDTDLRARMLDRFLREAGRADVFVAKGVPKHKAGDAEFSQRRWAEREPARAHADAATSLLGQIKLHPGQITLIAIAPLTNLAAAIDLDPATFHSLRRIVMMGGSVRRGYDDLGYTPDRGPSAEYNIAMDVNAAKKVFAAGVPIYLMPLDSTQLKLDEVKRHLLFTQSTNLTDNLALLYEQWSRATKQQTPTVFDAMAVAYAIQPSLCPTIPLHLRVDDEGRTREEAGPPNAWVCLKSDSDTFFSFYMPRLLQQADTP